MNHTYNQATFYLSQAKVRLFHLKVSTLTNRGDITEKEKDHLISLFQQQHNLSFEDYAAYAGLDDV